MDLSQLKGKRLLCMEEPRSPECIKQCGKTLPCTNNCYLDCTCECPIHPYPRFTLDDMRQLTSGDKICVRPQKEKKSAESLGDRMKEYEAQFSSMTLVPDKPWLARIDGHCFSKFTKGLQKPFDPLFSQAMEETAKDLLNQFQARTAYTQSDEITLVFVPVPIASDDEVGGYREWPFNGRVMKISGLMAGYASSRFNYHLNGLFSDSEELEEQLSNEYKQNVLDKMRSGTAHFDARVFTVPSLVDVYNNIYWRSAYDCVRNSVSALSRAHFSTKQLHGKSTEQKRQMLAEKDPNLAWDLLDERYRYGVFIKKEQYQMDCIDKKSNKPAQATRTRTVSFTHRLEAFDENFIKQLASKYIEFDYEYLANRLISVFGNATYLTHFTPQQIEKLCHLHPIWAQQQSDRLWISLFKEYWKLDMPVFYRKNPRKSFLNNIPPPRNSPTIAAGDNHSLGLLEDGTVKAWGNNDYGQTNIPDTNGKKFVEIAAGGWHSLGILEDGTCIGWGYNNYGQTNVPDTRGKKFVKIAAGGWHSLGILEDGTCIGWGRNHHRQTNVPDTNGRRFVGIAAGSYHSLGILEDGTCISWGLNNCGQTDVPDTNGRRFVGIAAGSRHSLGILEDGTVKAWGWNEYGQTNIPDTEGRRFIGIATGDNHSLAILEDGTCIGWGNNHDGQTDAPPPADGLSRLLPDVIILLVYWKMERF